MHAIPPAVRLRHFRQLDERRALARRGLLQRARRVAQPGSIVFELELALRYAMDPAWTCTPRAAARDGDGEL